VFAQRIEDVLAAALPSLADRLTEGPLRDGGGPRRTGPAAARES
jgi:hypothetical protein